MAQLKKCPYCKGQHRKLTAYKKCARRNGPRASWPRLGK